MFPIINIDDEIDLRLIKSIDANDIFKLVDANRDYLREWLPWLDINVAVEDSIAFIKRSEQLAEERKSLVMIILYYNKPVGITGYNWIDWLNRSCEIGYWIAQDHQKLGIVTRSVRCLTDYAFNTLNLNRVNLPIASGNVKSRSIPTRLGYQVEGVMREVEWLYDHFVDHVLYSMLQNDWKSANEAA